jgi:integrase
MPLKLYKRPRDKVWKVRGTLHGVRYEKNTGLTDERQAQFICDTLTAQINKSHVEATVLGRRLPPSFAKAVERYINKGGEKRFLLPFVRIFGEKPIDAITQEDIDDAAHHLLPGRAAATQNRAVYVPMSAVLKEAGVNITLKRPQENKKAKDEDETRWLTHEESRRLIGAASPHLRPLLVFLFLTGARIGEALWLDWRSVDLVRAHVKFPRTKNGKPRGLPLHPAVVAALSALPHRQGEIFRRPDGLPYERPNPENDDDTSAGSRIKTAFKAACRRAGIANFRVHDCRHTWATWHYMEHRDLLRLKEAGGWSSLTMVERYAHINRDHLRADIEALPSLQVG